MNASTSTPSWAALSVRAFKVWVAPNRRASSSRSGAMSEATMVVAPRALATCTFIRPMGPAPQISTALPAPICASYGGVTTVIERAPDLRDAGQNIDIRGAARTVILRMKLEEKILANSVATIAAMAVCSRRNPTSVAYSRSISDLTREIPTSPP